jgi:tetratricopeptide (TPR) repeat protein
MPKDKKKLQKKPSSLFAKSGLDPQIRKLRDLMEDEEYAEAVLLAEKLSHRTPENAEIAQIEARCLLKLEMPEAAMVPLARLMEYHPESDNTLNLGILIYLMNGMTVHSTRCCRRLLERSETEKDKERLGRMIEPGDKIIRTLSERLGVSYEDAEEGTFWLEEADFHLDEGRVSEALGYYSEAVEILPRAGNALAQMSVALFLNGQLDDAEATAHEALEAEPNHLAAQYRLMLCARARYDDAALQAAYAPLRERDPGDDEDDRITLIHAHGLAGNHEAAYALARRIAESGKELSGDALETLAMAAANRSRFQEAKGYARLLEGSPALEPPVRVALEYELPGPNLALRYPYLRVLDLLGQEGLNSFGQNITEQHRQGITAEKFDLSPILGRWPQIVWAAEKLLFEQDTDAGLVMLTSLGTKESIQVVRSVIGNPDVPYSAQVRAVYALSDAGFLPEEEPVTLRWGDEPLTATPAQVKAIFDVEELPTGLKVMLDEINRNPNLDRERVERIYRKALERYPDQPFLYHNLALCSFGDDVRELLEKALELKPDYHLARVTLATYLAIHRREEEMEKVLSEIPPTELSHRVRIGEEYARALNEEAHGRYQPALERAKRVLREDPEHDGAQALIKDLIVMLRHPEELLDEKRSFRESIRQLVRAGKLQ